MFKRNAVVRVNDKSSWNGRTAVVLKCEALPVWHDFYIVEAVVQDGGAGIPCTFRSTQLESIGG